MIWIMLQRWLLIVPASTFVAAILGFHLDVIIFWASVFALSSVLPERG